MKISKQARRTAKELFRACLLDGLLVEDRVRAVVQELIAKKPRNYLAVVSQFQRLVRLDLQRRTARVESAGPLTPELQSSVRDNLTRLYGRGLNISFGQNPELIGGLRVRVGSDVYDGSVQTRLQNLEEAFG
jgi:F-type H+-transporting ATPase subunit delta